jgi:hypothetical protein
MEPAVEKLVDEPVELRRHAFECHGELIPVVTARLDEATVAPTLRQPPMSSGRTSGWNWRHRLDASEAALWSTDAIADRVRQVSVEN